VVWGEGGCRPCSRHEPSRAVKASICHEEAARKMGGLLESVDDGPGYTWAGRRRMNTSVPAVSRSKLITLRPHSETVGMNPGSAAPLARFLRECRRLVRLPSWGKEGMISAENEAVPASPSAELLAVQCARHPLLGMLRLYAALNAHNIFLPWLLKTSTN